MFERSLPSGLINLYEDLGDFWNSSTHMMETNEISEIYQPTWWRPMKPLKCINQHEHDGGQWNLWNVSTNVMETKEKKKLHVLWNLLPQMESSETLVFSLTVALLITHWDFSTHVCNLNSVPNKQIQGLIVAARMGQARNGWVNGHLKDHSQNRKTFHYDIVLVLLVL
jgi:hypothetical protein